MTVEEHAQMKRWVDTWKETGPLMEKLRREELRAMDQLQAIRLLCGSFDFSKPPFRPEPTSGFIQQQALLKRMRRE